MLEVKVPQPKCTFCAYHHRHAEACGTKLKGVYLRPFSRYCTGGKRPKVFKPKDPKEKVPAWCPRRITPCAVRVYHHAARAEQRKVVVDQRAGQHVVRKPHSH